MNRQIKFRAWDTERKQWLNEEDTYQQVVNQARWNPEVGEIFPIMQFTGLKDKNGKEIYEGDVLERIGTRDNFTALPIETYKRELIVVELKVSSDKLGITSFGFSINTQQTYSERANHATYEVIGNVYENPDLIPHKQLKNNK